MYRHLISVNPYSCDICGSPVFTVIVVVFWRLAHLHTFNVTGDERFYIQRRNRKMNMVKLWTSDCTTKLRRVMFQ